MTHIEREESEDRIVKKHTHKRISGFTLRADLTTEQRKKQRRRETVVEELEKSQMEGITEDFKVQNPSRCCDRI